MKRKRSDGMISSLFVSDDSPLANSLGRSNPHLTIQALAIVLFSLLSFFVSTTSASVTLFGPKGFERTTGKPNVFQETFTATEGAGQLELFNGGTSSGSQVTSASVVLNGKQILGPNDFKKRVPFLQVPVMLKAQNTMEVTLASEPGTQIIVRLTQSFPFEEDASGVIKTDLAVTNLVLTPDRCAPQTQVDVQATVTNWGRRDSGPTTLILTVDGNEIGRKAVNPLRVGASAPFSINWTAQEPGRHQFWAHVEPGAGMFDRYPSNNSRLATLRVSGESSPVPELEFSPPQFNPGPPATITVTVHNPSFVDLSEIWLFFTVVGPPLAPQALQKSADLSVFGDIICDMCVEPDFIIPFLAAGESTEVQFAWPYDDTAGQYLVEIKAINLPVIEMLTASWDLVLPNIVATWMTNQPLWSSLGPYQITDNLYQGPPNTGRISSLAVSPENPKIIYASGATLGLQISGPGLWKTTDGGQSWKALGDKFPQMNIMAIAVDPSDPDIVYCTGGVWRFDPPTPVAQGLPNQITGYIFKSVNGGKDWVLFAHPADGYSKLVVRRLTGTSQVVVYAASNRGVLRYISTDPYAMASQDSEWPVILDGKIADVVVDPTDPNVVFAVRHISTGQYWHQLDGLYGTKTGLTAAGISDWPRRLLFTAPNPVSLIFVDLFKANPQKIYLLTWEDGWGFKLLHSIDQGDHFYLLNSFPTKCGTVNFVRAHPTIENLVYVGCDQPPVPNLLKISKWMGSWSNVVVPDIHVDQHAMEFFPDSNSSSGWGYVLANDGGVYRGSYFSLLGFTWDLVTPVNNGLVSAEFYDAGFDVFLNDPGYMIGGTQDNGVILYLPVFNIFNVWKYVAAGDGNAAVIAPSDRKTMYAKDTNGLHSGIIRSTNGGAYWELPKHNGLIDGGGPIFTDAGQSKVIHVGGAQVQRSIDGGDNWTRIGPDDPQKKGNIVQVLSPHILHLYAGTDRNAQIWFRTEGFLGPYWNLVHEHPDPDAYVVSMALAPSNSNVLYVVYGNCTKDKRLRRFELTPGYGWSSEWITGNLPEIHATTNTKVEINTIAVDPTDDGVAFVGTDKGVYQGMSETSWMWLPFNNGLPLVRISKLISVPLTGEIRASTSGRGVWRVKLHVSDE